MVEEDGEGREEDSPFLGTGAKESVVCRRFLIVKVWVATCESEAGGDQAIHEETYPNEAMDIWFARRAQGASGPQTRGRRGGRPTRPRAGTPGTRLVTPICDCVTVTRL